MKRGVLEAQREQHIDRLSHRLGVSGDEILKTMKAGYIQIHEQNNNFGLIDASDILPYLIDGEKDKDRYPETYEWIYQRYGEDTPLMIYILSATSIRSTLESNVAKAYSAFDAIRNDEDFL